MFEQDFIMRQIEMLAKGIAKMLQLPSSGTVLDTVISDESVISQEGYLRFKVMELLDEGRPGEAEDLLFNAVEMEQHREYMNIALEFYGVLAKKTEGELQAIDFSREEVLNGLKEIKEIYETTPKSS